MTRYYHRERRDWRYYLRHFLQRANAILAAAILLALLAPSVAQARTCPANYPVRIAHGCARLPGINTGARCDRGYVGQFTRRGGGWAVRCVAGPAVQP